MGAVSPEVSGLPAAIGRKEALEDLLEIKKVFDHFDVPLFITFGALLGIHRDGDFIEYDDDIDLCVTAEIDYKTRKAIGWKLFDLGFKPQPISFKVFDRLEPSEIGYNGDDKSGIIVCQKRIRTTIFFYVEERCPVHGREMVCIPKYGSDKLISTPAEFFDKPKTIKFKGHKFIAPSPIKKYLEWTYGSDWKTPIKGKNAPQYHELKHE